MEIVVLRHPVWFSGLEDPEWLLTAKSDAAPRIGFVAWSVALGRAGRVSDGGRARGAAVTPAP